MDIPTCVTNVCQSVSDHTGTDGLNWFSAIGPDLSGVPLWSEHAETSIPPDPNETSVRGKVQHPYVLMQYSSDTRSTLENAKN